MTRAKAKRKPGQPKRGPLPWDPTDEERKLVEHCISIGFTQEQTALVLDRSVDSLERHCRRELDVGKLKVDAKVGAKFIDKCMKGDTACLIFYHKTRRGWRETDRRELTGPDGRPIEFLNYDLTKLTDEELDELERIRARITVAGSDQGGEAPAGG